MPIKTRDEGEDLKVIEWTFENTIFSNDRKEETFQMNHFNSRTYYSIACSWAADDGKRIMYSTDLAHFWLRFKQAKITKSRDKLDGGHGYRQPLSTVWASFNGGEKSLLKEYPSSSAWKSGKFILHFSVEVPVLSLFPIKNFTFLLWIQFDTFSRGKRNILKQLADMFIQQTNCDIQFCLEGDQRVGGHKNILATRSSVFAAMFQPDMQQESKVDIVNIQDIEAEIFKELLHYIYSGQTASPLSDIITTQSLYVAADKYDVNDLKEECVDFLLSCVRIDSAINLMAWAHLHSVDELKKITLAFIVQHGKVICKLDDWEMLIKRYPDLGVVVTRRILE